MKLRKCPLCSQSFAGPGLLGHIRLGHKKSAREARELLKNPGPSKPKRKRRREPEVSEAEADDLWDDLQVEDNEKDADDELSLAWVLGIVVLMLVGPGILQSLDTGKTPGKILR